MTAPMPRAAVVWILTLLLGIQPVTTDLCLPALPTLQRELGANVAGAQATLSTLVICLGLAQLVCGRSPTASAAGRCSIAVAAIAWTLVQRHGEPVQAALLVAQPA